MLSRCSLAVCFLGLICLSVNVQAQQGKHAAEGRLSTTQLYSGIGSHSGDRATFRDSSGRTQGSATQSGNRTTFRDSLGRSVGSADTWGD